MNKPSSPKKVRRNRLRHHTEQQCELNFAEAETPFQEAMSIKRAQLRTINPELLIDGDGDPAPMSARRWRTASEVLMSIHCREYNSNSGSCQAPPDEIAKTAGCRKSTYYELRSELENVGLLIVEPGGLDRGGNRQPSKLTIDHVAIETLAEASRERRGNRYAKARRQTGIGRNGLESAGTGRTAPDPTGIHKETQNPLPLTKELSSSPCDTHRQASTEWEEEEKDLRKLGITKASAAVAAAREAGCSLAEWLRHRTYWAEHRHRWESSEGVLWSRLKELQPGGDLAPDAGWIPFNLPPADLARRNAAAAQWSGWDRERRVRVLREAGVAGAEVNRLLENDMGTAQRIAIAYVAPLLASTNTPKGGEQVTTDPRGSPSSN
ncbi:hypothetical protein [Botrimarina mediterranea]|uniref:hypothetical protein n=1 Tax=Botrimarina mediterranea TaxID=2528022 RepID=UPI0011882FE9|nr:hypothetical protein K2D_25180 [Planctomycetes bacterium K2D]